MEKKIKVVRTPGGRRRIPESEIERLQGEGIAVTDSNALAVYTRIPSNKKENEVEDLIEIVHDFSERIFSSDVERKEHFYRLVKEAIEQAYFKM